jgi:hypothetical protein
MPVLLKDIVDALEMQFEETLSFLDLDTGEVVTVSRELPGEAEDLEDGDAPELLEWEIRGWETAKRIVSTGGFIRLPNKFEVHEWSIMEDFAYSMESGRIREELPRAIHGSGAFRYFKDTIHRRKIEPAWYAFRAEALREIAIEWCEKNRIQWK